MYAVTLVNGTAVCGDHISAPELLELKLAGLKGN
jgi:hypothetical protein